MRFRLPGHEPILFLAGFSFLLVSLSWSPFRSFVVQLSVLTLRCGPRRLPPPFVRTCRRRPTFFPGRRRYRRPHRLGRYHWPRRPFSSERRLAFSWFAPYSVIPVVGPTGLGLTSSPPTCSPQPSSSPHNFFLLTVVVVVLAA